MGIFLVGHLPVSPCLEPAASKAYIPTGRQPLVASKNASVTGHHVEIDVIENALRVDRGDGTGMQVQGVRARPEDETRRDCHIGKRTNGQSVDAQ